jgi:hypothetical protein
MDKFKPTLSAWNVVRAEIEPDNQVFLRYRLVVKELKVNRRPDWA